ncbi:DUF7483 domain-containing protein [Magnetospirillum sulfuroxidans]|uniref:DUF7483 domain-containing protein n=1 Tax=Magnetospirillum sulfuroxidans TaxID=611300 RepID=A0ABS5IC01_9PROT|nr:LamG-like jellyroll fold domain-containing protein [Magnetospirillum sulfuroxidans]MBR9971223.1 hypothetical protein [Magnetospirillum sulfuroxidans]
MFCDSMMLGGGRKAAFSIANSVRLDGVADYFTRTPTVEGNRKTWTFSAWVKRCAIGTQQFLLITGINSNESESVFFDANDKLNLWVTVSNVWVGRLQTNAMFRDTTSWGHLMISKDVTTGTPKIYWNGTELPTTVLTEFANIEGYVNKTYEHRIGEGNAAIANGTFNGYITQPILVDGTALHPSAFGETDPVTGSWRPKRIGDLDFGINGFYLDFNDPTNLGKDVSKGEVVTVTAPIGNMTEYAGLAAAFDGVTNNVTNVSCATIGAGIGTTSPGWIGAHLGAGEPITAVRIYASHNDGFVALGSRVAVFELWGNSTDNTGTASKIADLGSVTDAAGLVVTKNGLSVSRDVYPYLWVKIYTSVAMMAGKYAAEVQFIAGGDAPNTFSPVSLGAADVVTDTPTNNFATINTLHSPGCTLSNGNLHFTTASGMSGVATASLGISSGKWGWKLKIGSSGIPSGTPSAAAFGIVRVSNRIDNTFLIYDAGTVIRHHKDIYRDGVSTSSSYSEPSTEDVYELLFDADVGTLVFSRNAIVECSVTGITTGVDWLPAFSDGTTYGSVEFSVDFGQAGYTPSDPAYKALCTANLPKPAIQAPAKHFDVLTYTGTGAPQTITGLGFAPDLVWVKARSNPTASWLHRLTSRGLTQPSYLSPNSTDAETSIVGNITSLDARGFTTNGNGGVGESGVSHVAWCWKAGGAPVANSAGTIASAVSVNPAAGFSIVTWDGDAANATIGHGLGAPPKFIIAKCRSAGGTDWSVYIGALAANTKLSLSGTNAAAAGSDWNSTAPTATVFSVGASANTNADGHSYIAYCWAEIPGFSKFASYSGNGSSDGPFVHCGFRPRFVLIKRTDAVGNWSILDTERSPTNDGRWESLQANSALPESGIAVDGVSSGFKIRETAGDINASGGAYIFAAFAEAPFGGIKTVPAKAR